MEKETPVVILLQELGEILDDPTVVGGPGVYLTDTHPDQVEWVVEAACAAFIDGCGRANFAAMAEFRQVAEDAGLDLRVGSGETDSFGWLSGVIYTPKGMIVYG